MTIQSKVAPEYLYYALVDGTSEVDSVAFGTFLTREKGFGRWSNLLNRLPADPNDEAHLVDPAHDFLPIIRLNGNAQPDKAGVAVVCPGGLGSKGIDRRWRNYDPTPHIWIRRPEGLYPPVITRGRNTALEESAQVVEHFILEPAVQVERSGTASLLSGEQIRPGAEVFRASLLYVSSHGWLGGFMAGEAPQLWPEAEPEEARKGRHPYHSYFLIGRVDAEARCFHGPVWVVLAQCSTLNEATWPMWARVMARSDPPVRGILGYEESSPDAGASIGIAKGFFAALSSGKNFLEAWRDANTGQHWAAIVHAQARNDRLVAFPAKRLEATSLIDYRGYLPLKDYWPGRPVKDEPPPFKVELYRLKGRGQPNETAHEIRSDNLDQSVAAFGSGKSSSYLIRITASAPMQAVSVQLVHIRESYPKQFRPRQLFESVTSATNGVTINDSGAKTIEVRLTTPSMTVELRLSAHPADQLEKAGLKKNHSYLWIAAEVRTMDGSTLRYKAQTLGLLYYG